MQAAASRDLRERRRGRFVNGNVDDQRGKVLQGEVGEEGAASVANVAVLVEEASWRGKDVYLCASRCPEDRFISSGVVLGLVIHHAEG